MYLFVYGTLRFNAESKAHQQYLAGADFISPAKIRGQLYQVDYYPGLRLSQADEWVLGDVYLLKDAGQLHRIDVYEDYDPHSPHPQEYKRETVEVLLPTREVMEAWTYIFQRETSSLVRIESGDFLAP